MDLLDALHSPPVVLILVWPALLFAIAHLGWRQIAAKYPAPAKPEGPCFRAVSARMRPTGGRYGGCLDVTLASAGIYIAIQFPLRPGDSPMLMP